MELSASFNQDTKIAITIRECCSHAHRLAAYRLTSVVRLHRQACNKGVLHLLCVCFTEICLIIISCTSL